MNIQERKVIIIVISSLVVAVVTYGFLESTGTIENKVYKFGGAIAGFLATAYLLNRIYGPYRIRNREESIEEPKIRENKEEVISKISETAKSEDKTLKQQNEVILMKEKRGIMGLTEEIDSFFIQYGSADKRIEEYGLDLSKILHSLADELEGIELESINDTCSKLENLCYETKGLRKELRSSPTQQKRERLRTIGETIRTNINDFRHGDILHRYRKI